MTTFEALGSMLEVLRIESVCTPTQRNPQQVYYWSNFCGTHHSCTCGVDPNLKAGMLVDVACIVRDKDKSNRIGPCTVVETSDIREGVVHCKWQGRTMPDRVSKIRFALSYELLYVMTANSLCQKSALLKW